MTDDTITFAEQLTRLGYGTGTDYRSRNEHVSVCHQVGDGRFCSEIVVWDQAPGLVKVMLDKYPAERNFWFGVNALGEVSEGRGKESDVTRLAALYAEFDIKKGGCPNMDAALDIIDDISAILGQRPVVVTHSGHGLHAYWAIDVESARTLTNREAKRLLERFGRLVKAVAAHHGCQVDSVFDLARVLRVAETNNYKDPDNPVPVRCLADAGNPITVEQICTALDTYGITEERPRVRAGSSGDGTGPVPDEYYSRTCLINRVAQAPNGRRNKTLFGATLDAAKQGDLDDEMVEALETATEACGLSWEDGSASVRNTMESAVRTAEGQGYRIDGNPWTKAKTRERMRASASQGEQQAPDDDEVDASEEPEANFWSQRDTLQGIHDFARSKGGHPVAVLGGVLRRAIARVEPRVKLPGIVGGVVSANLFTVTVGGSGLGKDLANEVAAAAVEFRSRDDLHLAEPLSPGIGSGEGLARVFKGFGNGADLERTKAHLIVNEVNRLKSLADRKGYTAVSELLQAYMGQPLGFSNAQKATTTFIPQHSYRLCLGISAQPENADFFLSREKDGFPQRFLWLPTIDPHCPPPGDEEQAVEHLTVTIPAFDNGLFGADGEYLIGVPKPIRERIRHFRWLVKTGSPDVDPLDGHLMLTRLKASFGLALLEGRQDIDEDDWRIAGQLLDISKRVRDDTGRVIAESRRRSNRARAHDQADREAIIAEKLSEKTQQRVVKAITRKLSRVGAATRRDLHQACDSSISRDFPAVFDLMVDQGLLVAEGGEGNATRYRFDSV